MKLGQYAFPLHFACGSLALGSLLYGLAYKTKFLYLILLGRMVQGLGYTFFMYSKRYCSDPRIAGIRRRTLLAGWLVVGQGIGLSAGPFFGGLLFKIGFKNDVFNGYSSPGWVMFFVFLAHWVVVALFFKDVPREESANQDIELSPGPSASRIGASLRQLNKRQWGVIATMCWFAMANFFILGAWGVQYPCFCLGAYIDINGGVRISFNIQFNKSALPYSSKSPPEVSLSSFPVDTICGREFPCTRRHHNIPVPVPQHGLFSENAGSSYPRIGLRLGAQRAADRSGFVCVSAGSWIPDVRQFLRLLVPGRSGVQPRNHEHAEPAEQATSAVMEYEDELR